MNYSRRDLASILAAATAATAAAAAAAQESQKKAEPPKVLLKSQAYPFKDIPMTEGKTGVKSRKVLRGLLHKGFDIDTHITELPPGASPHGMHHHPHEEIMCLRQGTIEVNVDGKITRLEAGSVSFVGSGVEHTLKNVG